MTNADAQHNKRLEDASRLVVARVDIHPRRPWFPTALLGRLGNKPALLAHALELDIVYTEYRHAVDIGHDGMQPEEQGTEVAQQVTSATDHHGPAGPADASQGEAMP